MELNRKKIKKENSDKKIDNGSSKIILSKV